MPSTNHQSDSPNRSLLNTLMNQDRFLASGPQSTTPIGSPARASIPGQAPPLSQSNALQRRGHGVPNALYGQLQPFVAPPTAQPPIKRKPQPASDPEDDHDMLGKDVPTLFKRQRRRTQDDPFQHPGEAPFVRPNYYVFDASSVYGTVHGTDGVRGDIGNGPAIQRNGTIAPRVDASGAAGTASGGPSLPGPSAPPPDDNDMAVDRFLVSEQDFDAMDADDEDGSHNPPRRTGRAQSSLGPPRSTYASQSEVTNIRHDLQMLNNNMSQLVTLVGQQTQFFSTLQGRGFFDRSSGTASSQSQSSESSNPGPGAPLFTPIPRRTRRGRAKEPKRKGLPVARDIADVALSDKIRTLTRELMKRKNAKTPLSTSMLPDDQEVIDYDPHKGPCCTADNFRPDLRAAPSSVWNQSVIEVFVDRFLGANPSADRARVEEMFEGHLKYLCTKWQTSNKLDEDALKERAKLLRRAERQRQLYYRRLSVAYAYGPLQVHIPMLEALGVQGMSSDESDHRHGVAQYGVLKKPWRSAAATAWLRVFDCLYRRLRANEVQQNTPGSHPHLRFSSERTSSTSRHSPVKHLPRNAYDAEWLQKLDKYDRKLLGVKENSVYNFTHHADMQKLAADYSGKHNPLGIYF